MRLGIKAVIHAMRMKWDADGALEDQGFLLVDAKNAFSSQNQVMMLQAVHHYWPSSVMFVLCYKKWRTLVVRDGQCSAFFIPS